MVGSITPLLSLIVLSIMLHEERPGITAMRDSNVGPLPSAVVFQPAKIPSITL